MKKCKINYNRLNAADLHELCGQVIGKLTGNANFPALPTTLADMTEVNAVLQTDMDNSVNGDRQKLAALRAQKLVVANILRSTASYVNSISNGNDEMLLSSGLHLTKTPEKQGIPQRVTDLTAVYTNLPGKVELTWKGAKFAKSYNVYIRTDESQPWTMLPSVFVKKLMVQALVSKTRYQFKVIGANKSGLGQESDLASQIAA